MPDLIGVDHAGVIHRPWFWSVKQGRHEVAMTITLIGVVRRVVEGPVACDGHESARVYDGGSLGAARLAGAS